MFSPETYALLIGKIKSSQTGIKDFNIKVENGKTYLVLTLKDNTKIKKEITGQFKIVDKFSNLSTPTIDTIAYILNDETIGSDLYTKGFYLYNTSETTPKWTYLDIGSKFKLEEWVDNKAYKTDDYVVYDEKIFICLDDNTSTTDFYNDLASGYWELVVGSKSYEETIITPSKKWIIQHNLNLKDNIPTNIYIFDNDGNEVIFPDINYKTMNQLEVSFDTEISGSIKVIK